MIAILSSVASGLIALAALMLAFLIGRTVERDAAARKVKPPVPPIVATFDVSVNYELPQPLYIRPREGDRAVVHLPSDATREEAEQVRRQWRERFPDVPMVVVAGAAVEASRGDG